MRAVGLGASGLLLLSLSAWAQQPPIQQQSLPPLQRQWEQDAAPPEQSPDAPPPTQGQGDTAAQPQPAGPVMPPAVTQIPDNWLPAAAVKLQALDKEDAQATDLTIKVGESATVGPLTITVKACVVRPPSQPGDAAAFLDVTDSHPDSPGFNGWMLKDEPSVSMMQNPIYDIRVTGCA